jgi:N-acetylmuramoyl-L-alanine amidase
MIYRFLFLFAILFSFSTSSFAQNVLTRVSSVTRSDGKGYVVRMHLQNSVDSAKVLQADPGLIQVLLYDDNISLSTNFVDPDGPALESIDITELPIGIGINLNLMPDVHVTANIYPDANKHDWLTALTITDKETISILTDGLEPINWDDYKPEEVIINYADSTLAEDDLVLTEDDSLYQNLEFEMPNDEYSNLKSRVKFDTIVLDAGHGGHDPGTVGATRSKEKDIVLKVVKKLGKYLNENIPELNVVYTREDDTFVELEDRGHIGNRAGGDLFVSIHCNGVGNPYVQGAEVFFLGQHKSDDAYEIMQKENKVVRLDATDKTKELSDQQLLIYELTNSGYMATSQRLASMVDEQFKNRAMRKSRGVKQAGFIVLYYASMPSILVELGFITNRNDERFLNSDYGQTIMASAIFRAIRDYYVISNGQNKR